MVILAGKKRLHLLAQHHYQEWHILLRTVIGLQALMVLAAVLVGVADLT
jgi:hypothetical protein